MNAILRNRLIFFLLPFVVFGFGCHTHGKAERGKEKLLSATQPVQPDWIDQKPALEGGYFTLVGSSGDCITKELSHGKAVKDAQARIIRYLTELARSKFKKMSISDDLVRRVFDPNQVASGYRHFLSDHVVARIKGSEAYEEKWNRAKGVIYRSFILVRMPIMVIESSIKNFARYQAIKARQAAQTATDRKARRQAHREALFWNNLDPGILGVRGQGQDQRVR